MRNQLDVDWSEIPAPEDDGAARHLHGMALPPIRLPATDGADVDLSSLPGSSVVYVFPRMGRPDRPLPDGWNMLPGARGCTPQSCAFRDHFAELREAGVNQLFGLSSQSTEDQREAAGRLHLPFALLSDERFLFCQAMNLPVFETHGLRLLKRLTLIVRDGRVEQVFYPVFPPDRNAADVLAYLRGRI